LVGKWHLGLSEGSRPEDHGFDQWFGFLAGCIDYYSHIFYWGMNRGGAGNDPTHDLWENGKEIFINGRYFTELITERAVSFIRQAAASDKPFFLYVPWNAPHYPMHAPKKYVDRFPHLPPDRRIMAAMLSAMDDGVGEILAELERQNMTDETCVFFTSDNGPSRETRNWLDGKKDVYYGGTTGGLKGHKGSLFEGGIRVPGILTWPGRISPGTVTSQPAASMDIFPTFLSAAGGNTDEYEIDGRNILPLVSGEKQNEERTIFWEMNDQTAVRKGKWKMVLNGRLVENEKPVDDVHLANLDEDRAESKNLKEEMPQLAEELKESARNWRAGIEKRWKEEWQPNANGTT
jgi:arylsulfatase A-like enzyme